MNRWAAHIILALLLLSLGAPQVVALPLATAPCTMPCCAHCGDTSCPCPMEKSCQTDVQSTGDRAVAQPQPKVAARMAVLLYTLIFDAKTVSAPPVRLASFDTKPPSDLGSPPQARLRVWLL